MGDITVLIQRAQGGDRGALDALFDALYPELRRIAHARLTRNLRDTLLDTTALVHECYVKFSQAQRLGPSDRAHFLAYAATAMRSIIVDFARAKAAERRGGDAPHVTLNTALADGLGDRHGEDEIVRVHEALDELAKLDARLAQVVEMRYFAGLSELEIAELLQRSERSIRRDWQKARLFLLSAMADS